MALVGLLPIVPATSQNDAGSGGDAGNSRAEATSLPGLGSYDGTLISGDEDWYQLSVTPSGPTCYDFRQTETGSSNLRLQMETASGTRYATTRNDGSTASVSMATAAPAVLVPAAKKLSHEATSYTFGLTSLLPPSIEAGDALSGTDAGATLSSALAVSPGCIGGRLAALTLGELVDVYSIPLVAGQQVTYSFASDSTDLTLKLLDASGNAVGPSVKTGGMAIFDVSETGTYYLQSSASSGLLDDPGYVIGLVIGPPDPGNPCRPQC